MEFIDKAGAFCEKAVNATVDFVGDVSDNTKLFIEKQKLKSKVNDEIANIEKNYKEIGKRFFAKNEQNPPSEYTGIFASIKSSRITIDELRKKIDELGVIGYCDFCNGKIRKGQTFCGDCGMPFSKPAKPSFSNDEAGNDSEVKIVNSDNIEVL